jgi:peroxiredoxin
MKLFRLLETKTAVALGIFILVAVIGFGGYKWYYRFGITHAPDVNMITLDGSHSINLKELQGRPILLTFWSSDCPDCMREIPHLKTLYQELSPNGLAIVSVSVYWDEPERLRTVVVNQNIPYSVIYDANKVMYRAVKGYGFTPTSFLINPQGRVVMKMIGEMNISVVRKKILPMLENE